MSHICCHFCPTLDDIDGLQVHNIYSCRGSNFPLAACGVAADDVVSPHPLPRPRATGGCVAADDAAPPRPLPRPRAAAHGTVVDDDAASPRPLPRPRVTGSTGCGAAADDAAPPRPMPRPHATDGSAATELSGASVVIGLMSASSPPS